MNKTINLLIGAALLAVPLTVQAEEPSSVPDLSELQRSLAAERRRIDELAKVTARAESSRQQQLTALQEENQQLRAEVARLHEQIQVSEGRAALAEAEREQLRGDLAKLREVTATAAEDARRSLVTVVSRIKDLNNAAARRATPEASQPQAEQKAAAPEPPAPKPETKRLARAKPAPVRKEPEQVETASATPPEIGDAHRDERAVLGGRPAALSFANMPAEKRQQIRELLTELHSGMDERGLITTVPSDSLFARGSDRLRLRDSDTLSKVGDLIKLTGNRQVRIIAHTDSLGVAEYNQRLSERQAAAIKQYLVENRGLAATQMSAEGVGDSTPIASDETVDGRNANRRVDFLILN